MQLDTVIQRNASASEELASMAEEMEGQARHLMDSISYFRLTEDGHAGNANHMQLKPAPLQLTASTHVAAPKPRLPAPAMGAKYQQHKDADAAPMQSSVPRASKGVKLDLGAIQDDKFEEF